MVSVATRLATTFAKPAIFQVEMASKKALAIVKRSAELVLETVSRTRRHVLALRVAQMLDAKMGTE
jgi:hypothetical protein